MSEELLINVNDFETRIALLEGGELAELHVGRASGYSCIGNIYLGKVERIAPGIRAAFVDIGLDRPGFLHNRRFDSSNPSQNGDHPAPGIRDLVYEGEEVLVQAIKDPVVRKGVRLTSALSLATRHLVLTPQSGQTRISRRIEDERERERLRDLIAEVKADLNVKMMGFIARTAAQGIERQAVETDMRQLLRVWNRILARRANARRPSLIYEEAPLHLRALRELCGVTPRRVLVDDAETFRRVRAFAEEYLPKVCDRIETYEGPPSLFEHFGIEDVAAKALLPRLSLKCGGSLVIEQTEAMTTIDVNTGSFLGGARFEETIFRTNLEAAAAIPRQLRLRNIGGIIVVDFIDMENEEHKRQVLRTLEKASEGDRAQFAYEGFSSFGLVQIRRKRTRKSLAAQLCEPCANCQGVGITKSSETTCIDILRATLRDAKSQCPGTVGSYLIRASEAVVDRLLDEDAAHLTALSNQFGQEMRLQVEPSYGPGCFDLVFTQDAHT